MPRRLLVTPLFLALLALGCSASKTSPSNKPNPDSDSTTMSGMAMSKQELSNKAGIPIFPGAALPEGKSSVTPTPTETRYSLVMETPAKVSEIVDFYTGKIPGLSANKTSTSGDLIGQTAQGSLAHIKISTQAGKRLIEAVAIVESSAKTPDQK